MLFTGALLILFVVAIPTSIGGIFLARSCLRGDVQKGVAGIALGLNIALAVMLAIAIVAVALGVEPRSGAWWGMTAITVYLIPLSTIVSILLDVVLLTAKLGASREAGRESRPASPDGES